MLNRRSHPLLAALALAGVFGAVDAHAAQLPGEHPSYLHALSDLRHARWNLMHRAGDAAVEGQERLAVEETDQAISEAEHAAARDGKNIAQDEHEDATLDHAGALHHAQDLLVQARHDIAMREDNPETREARDRAVVHIDRALEATRHAIHDVEQHR